MCCAVHAQGVDVDGGERGKKGRGKVKRGEARLVDFLIVLVKKHLVFICIIVNTASHENINCVIA